MSTNKTSNYQLNQWVKSDKVLMEEFNADNAKIDAALASKASTSALSSAQSTLNSKITNLQSTVSGQGTALSLRNCRFVTGSYQGEAQEATSGPVTLTFPYKPVFVFLCATIRTTFFTAARGQSVTYRTQSLDTRPTYLEWGERTLKWSPLPTFAIASSQDQMNESVDTYHYFAILEVN